MNEEMWEKDSNGLFKVFSRYETSWGFHGNEGLHSGVLDCETA